MVTSITKNITKFVVRRNKMMVLSDVISWLSSIPEPLAVYSVKGGFDWKPWSQTQWSNDGEHFPTSQALLTSMHPIFLTIYMNNLKEHHMDRRFPVQKRNWYCQSRKFGNAMLQTDVFGRETLMTPLLSWNATINATVIRTWTGFYQISISP